MTSCKNNKLSQNQILNHENKESNIGLNLLKFTYLSGIENGEKIRTKFLTLEVANNQDKSIYFSDSIVSPTVTHKYRGKKLLGESITEVIIDDFVEIAPHSRDTFYMPVPAQEYVPKANVFDFLICYYLSPLDYDNEVCQNMIYKIDNELIEKIK